LFEAIVWHGGQNSNEATELSKIYVMDSLEKLEELQYLLSACVSSR